MTGKQIVKTHPLANTAIVLFDFYFWKGLGLDSKRYCTAVTASCVYFESLAFKSRQFSCKLWWVIGRLIFVPAIITLQRISMTLFEGIKIK